MGSAHFVHTILQVVTSAYVNCKKNMRKLCDSENPYYNTYGHGV